MSPEIPPRVEERRLWRLSRCSASSCLTTCFSSSVRLAMLTPATNSITKYTASSSAKAQCSTGTGIFVCSLTNCIAAASFKSLSLPRRGTWMVPENWLTDLPFAWAKGALDECFADVVIFSFRSYCKTIDFLAAVCHLISDQRHCSRQL